MSPWRKSWSHSAACAETCDAKMPGSATPPGDRPVVASGEIDSPDDFETATPLPHDIEGIRQKLELERAAQRKRTRDDSLQQVEFRTSIYDHVVELQTNYSQLSARVDALDKASDNFALIRYEREDHVRRITIIAGDNGQGGEIGRLIERVTKLESAGAKSSDRRIQFFFYIAGLVTAAVLLIAWAQRLRDDIDHVTQEVQLMRAANHQPSAGATP